MKESRGDEKALHAEGTCVAQPHLDTDFELSSIHGQSTLEVIKSVPHCGFVLSLEKKGKTF